MKTIERYVFGSFFASFVLAFLVLSFVLTISLLVQIDTFIMDGVSMSLVGEFCMVSLPETLQWSVPISLLVSSVLVFSRLSADSEIAAMRACGIHLLRVARWPIVFGLCCTLLGLFVNNEIVPRGHQVRRTLKKRVSVDAGLCVLEPGQVIDDFPGMKLYFGSRQGNWLHDLVIYNYTDPESTGQITAEKVLVSQEGDDLRLELYQATFDSRKMMGRAERFPYTIKDVFKTGRYRPTEKDACGGELLREIAAVSRARDAAPEDGLGKKSMKRELAGDVTSLKVELSKRVVFAMASLCFVLLGIPLGIRSQRKESTVGMAISLATALGYYLVVILMMSLEKHSALHPEILIFLPVVVCFALSAHFIRKHL